MAIICPTVLATTEADYARQMRIASGLSNRIQIDLMDGEFTPSKSVGIDEVWWPPHVIADIHLMYKDPFEYLEKLHHLRPNMVIVHVETMIHHMHFAAELHKEGITAGLAIMPDTPVANIEQILHSFDHLLIFSGDLGHFGGAANLGMLTKVQQAKAHHEDIEIGWDGGINDTNAKQLAEGGVDILNVGGYIQKADDSIAAYETLVESLE